MAFQTYRFPWLLFFDVKNRNIRIVTNLRKVYFWNLCCNIFTKNKIILIIFETIQFLLDNPSTEEKFHQEFRPPADGSYTGLGKQEKVVAVIDPSNDREQVQQR